MKELSENVSEKLSGYLEKAIFYDNADMGSIQLYDPITNTLHIVAHIGFDSEFLKHFEVARPFDASASGRAAGTGNPVVIDDILLDYAYAPHFGIARSAGFRSVKSVPIVGEDAKLLGIISTYFKEPQWFWEIHKLDDLVQILAGLLQTRAW